MQINLSKFESFILNHKMMMQVAFLQFVEPVEIYLLSRTSKSLKKFTECENNKSRHLMIILST